MQVCGRQTVEGATLSRAGVLTKCLPAGAATAAFACGWRTLCALALHTYFFAPPPPSPIPARLHSKTGPVGFWYRILPVAYSIFSALLGTQSVLFSKSMSVILRVTISGDNQVRGGLGGGGQAGRCRGSIGSMGCAAVASWATGRGWG